MEIILLEKIENLGGIGDRVNVKSGYGRNYLLPQGKATLATAENIARFEAMRAELEAKAAEEMGHAQGRAQKLAGLSVDITAKVGPEGKLFGSIGTHDIAEAVTAGGISVERSEVRLPEGPIRVAGEHRIDLHLHTDLTVGITVNVIGEELAAEEIAAAAMVAAEIADEPVAESATTSAEQDSQEGAEE